MCYFADSNWWQWQIEGRAKPKLGLTAAQVRERFASFAGQKCSIQHSGANITDPAVHFLRNRDYPSCANGLSLDQEQLVTGGHSGFQALNFSILTGAQVVPLLAYDARDLDPGQPSHWHGGHEIATPVGAYALYRQAFKDAAKAIQAAGVRVINCSPGSAINCFERMELQTALSL